jgi:hypothetical protein
MPTDQQVEANRLNAQKSTGPKTPEGKAAVRLNAVKFGLHAATLVLKGESEEEFHDLFDSFVAQYQPVTATEQALLVQLAMAAWRLRRLVHMESGYYAYKLKDLADIGRQHHLDDHGRLGVVADFGKTNMAIFVRQEAHFQRAFARAHEALLRIRAQRTAELALISQSIARPVAQVPDLPVKKTNNIQPTTPPESDATPAPVDSTM